jgi:uncharacterized protein (TIGR02246 family)
MTDTRSPVFLPTAGAGPTWDLAREQLSHPRSASPSLDELRDELAVREALARYTYSFDRGDLDGVMRFFSDDCTVTDRQGTTHRGRDEVRANYKKLIDTADQRFHLWTNVVVRFSYDLREAWRISYFHAYLAHADGAPEVVGGPVVDHMVKQDSEWRIHARSVTVDLDYTLDSVG